MFFDDLLLGLLCLFRGLGFGDFSLVGIGLGFLGDDFLGLLGSIFAYRALLNDRLNLFECFFGDDYFFGHFLNTTHLH